MALGPAETIAGEALHSLRGGSLLDEREVDDRRPVAAVTADRRGPERLRHAVAADPAGRPGLLATDAPPLPRVVGGVGEGPLDRPGSVLGLRVGEAPEDPRPLVRRDLRLREARLEGGDPRGRADLGETALGELPDVVVGRSQRLDPGRGIVRVLRDQAEAADARGEG